MVRSADSISASSDLVMAPPVKSKDPMSRKDTGSTFLISYKAEKPLFQFIYAPIWDMPPLSCIRVHLKPLRERHSIHSLRVDCFNRQGISDPFILVAVGLIDLDVRCKA